MDFFIVLMDHLSAVFFEHPGLAALLGGLFLVCFLVSRRLVNAIAGVAWLLYSGYETAIQRHVPWLCHGDCNLRIDVWVIYPVLLVISVAGLVALVRRQLTRRAS